MALSEEEEESERELMVIRTFRRLIGPIFVPIFRPLIRQLVKDELAKQKALTSMKEGPENKAGTSVLKRLKLQFRNKIDLPVYTGLPLLGENKTPIEIALVDALSGQIVNTGDESYAKLEILAFQVVDDDGDGDATGDDEWKFQEKILRERKGKRKRILQGKTSLQLKGGVGFVDKKISFTHNSEHTRNGLYRLVATVVDAAVMDGVEAACTETFVLKDYRITYHEKHACPMLSDEVYRLQQISYNGARYKRLKNEGMYTVKDLLKLLYTDPERLEDILELKASSKSWDEIVKNAQSSNGMFLYIESKNGGKTGVVLDVKLELKGLIVEPHLYIAVNQLSEQQKVETQDLVKFASEHFDLLRPFDHETSLEEYLQSVRKNEPSRPLLEVTKASHSLNDSIGTRGKEKVPFDSCEIMNVFDINSPMLSESQLTSLLNDIPDILNENTNEIQPNPAIVSFCNIARERWTKVSKLLRRNSVRERISLSQGIQPLKKQRCC